MSCKRMTNGYFRMKKFLLSQKNDIIKICGSIMRGSIAIIIVALFLWGIGQLLGYRVDIKRSFQEKILKKFVVLNTPPRTRIFTFYGTEFGLSTSGKTEYIEDGIILKAKKKQNLFLGVWNDEGINLHNVSCIISIPKGVKVINRVEIPNYWIEMLINEQYEYVYRKDLKPKTGRMFHPTLRMEFLEQKEYNFQYAILCDDFLPKKGSFVLKVE